MNFDPRSTSSFTFSESEYENRLRLVREKMSHAGADVLLVDCVEHMTYLFGYSPPAAIYQAALLPVVGPPVAIVRALDASTFVEQSWLTDTILFRDWENPIDVLVQAFHERGWANSSIAVEFDSHFMPVKRFRSIERGLPEATFVDFSNVIWEIRLLKSDAEIACLRRAARIADNSIMAAINKSGEGVPERECAAAIYAEAMRTGADNTRLMLMAAGKRSDSLHGRLGDHVLESGDILHTELVPTFRGYGARVMRSTSIGAPDDVTASIAGQLIELQDRQFETMRPGAIAGDVDKILRESVIAAGLRKTYENFTGYTLGYVGLPRTSDFTRTFLPGDVWELEPRMAFHMYTSAGGLAFSDTILITNSGAERLTKTPRQLFVR